MSDADDIRQSVADFWPTPEGQELRQRMDLAVALIAGMRRRNWSNWMLARKAGLSERFVTALVFSEKPCPPATEQKLLEVLG